MTSPFAVTVHGTYTRSEVPPRCRKPRPVLYDTTATVTVESVSSSAAPVALRVTELRDEERAPSEIRTYQGRLYAPHESYYRQEGPTVPGDSRFPSEVTTHRYDHASSSEEFLSAIIDAYKPFLIIDGIVWAETSEPGYLVATFGIGGVNGTTSLMVSDRTDYGTLFRADEFEAARAHAVEVSQGSRRPGRPIRGRGCGDVSRHRSAHPRSRHARDRAPGTHGGPRPSVRVQHRPQPPESSTHPGRGDGRLRGSGSPTGGDHPSRPRPTGLGSAALRGAWRTHERLTVTAPPNGAKF